MKNLFHNLYLLIQKYKGVAAAFFGLFIAGCFYLVSTLKLEENIINVIPKDDNLTKISEVLEGFKINNRLVFHIYTKDSLSSPEHLIEHSTIFADSLRQKYPELIQNIQISFSDQHLETLYSLYSEKLPIYLTAEDYEQINQKITSEGLENTLKKNYKALVSPLSIVNKKMLINDPLGIVNLPLQKSSTFQTDENIKLYQNHLLSQDQKHLIFFVELANPPNETSNNGKLIKGINRQIEAFSDTSPDFNIEYFGQTAIAVANANQIKEDIFITISLALIVLFLFISFFYRNMFIFFIGITPGLFGALVALAVLALVKGTVSTISLGVGSILLGITIDYSLHLFTHYKDHKEASTLFRDLNTPLLISSLTTAAAFLSLIFLHSEALADFGIFAGVSVLAGSIYTLTVLPHFIIRKNNKTATKENPQNFIEKTVSAIAEYPFFKAKWSLLLLLFLSVASLFTWKNYAFEDDMNRLHYMPPELAAYEENINRISTFSANTVFAITSGQNLEDALEKELKTREKLEKLKDQGNIFSYTSVNDLVPAPSVQRERLHQWNSYWQEHNADSVYTSFISKASQTGFKADGFSTFETLLKNTYAPLEQEHIEKIFSVFGDDYIVSQNGKVSVISTIKTTTEHKASVINVLEELDAALAFDKSYLTSSLIRLLQEDFNKLVNISLIVVFLIIFITYGRIEVTLVIFTPILVSWLWILGIMGFFDLRFNIVNIVVCTFIFGLGVDYSIFTTRGYLQDAAKGLKTILSYKKSIILSAVTTLLSIGVLAFARHPALQSIALLAIIGITSVTFITFTLQPLLYNFLIIKRKQKGLIPYTFKSLFLSSFAFVYFLTGCLILSLIRAVFYLPILPSRRKKLIYHHVIRVFCSSLVYIMRNVNISIVGKSLADFSKPSVIIANHHSFLDILLMLMLHHKVVMVTNDWVYNSPFFGSVVKYADFISTTVGVEEQVGKIEKLIEEGYSIVIFPEGTRSNTAEIGRFHKGALFLAQHFKLDIQPVILHGTSYTMPKSDGFYLKSGNITVKFLPRIAYGSELFGSGYSEATKKISRYFKSEYKTLRMEQENPLYYKETILKNYLYKGPVLEWYLKVKFRLEGYYLLLHELIPAEAKIYDIGCGYGLISYSLAFSSSKRHIIGIDYDQDKIETAANCPVKPSGLSFIHADVTGFSFEKADVFIISDLLHYLLCEEQMKLLKKIIDNLPDHGMIIIRDGNSSNTKLHKRTALTEVFSTRYGFNKTQNSFCYISDKMVQSFAENNNLSLKTIDNTKYTSNTLFILEKSGNGKV
ncbi:MMPL family transporter [Cytophagaceae bacterium ABcell3]|nr:MMPL family transporter [Cytophagaceae bacterium ABcell3]